MRDGHLEIEYQIVGLTRELYVPLPEWSGCEIRQDENFDLTLVVAEEGLSSGLDLEAIIRAHDVRIRRFVLAIEFQIGQSLQYRRTSVRGSMLSQRDGAEVGDTILFSDSCEARIVGAPAPNEMPQAPLEAERWIRTFAEAGALSGFVEEQLRRHYLLIEELGDRFMANLEDVDRDEIEVTKILRDFVSHAECSGEKVVRFVSEHLPSAVVSGRSRPTVRFDRLNPEHRALVARHEVRSARIARELVQHAIADLQQSE